MFRLFVVAAAVFAATAALAQTNGTYTTSNGYALEATFQGDTLKIVEPSNGKTSLYRRTGQGVYEFTNPTNGIAYTMEVVDAKTLLANKPGAPRANGTPLTLAGSSGATAPIAESERSGLEGIATHYLELAKSDPANAQAWSFCGFAAMSRAQGGGDSQVRQAAQALRMIATTSVNPCPKAIPQTIWNSAG
jgi:hypothetical protein